MMPMRSVEDGNLYKELLISFGRVGDPRTRLDKGGVVFDSSKAIAN